MEGQIHQNGQSRPEPQDQAARPTQRVAVLEAYLPLGQMLGGRITVSPPDVPEAAGLPNATIELDAKHYGRFIRSITLDALHVMLCTSMGTRPDDVGGE